MRMRKIEELRVMNSEKGDAEIDKKAPLECPLTLSPDVNGSRTCEEPISGKLK